MARANICSPARWGGTQYRSVLSLLRAKGLHHTQAHFPPLGLAALLGPLLFGTHPARRVCRQFPGAHHRTVTLYHQPRFPPWLALVVLDGSLVLLIHQPFGALGLALHHLPDAAPIQRHPVVFPKLPAGLGKGLFRPKVRQDALQGGGFGPALQARQSLERAVPAMPFGAPQLGHFQLDGAKGAQPPEGLELVEVASLTTGTKPGLALGLLGFGLRPGLQALLAQLTGKLAHLLLPSVGVPLLPGGFLSFLGQAFLKLSHCQRQDFWNTGCMAASLLGFQLTSFVALQGDCHLFRSL